MKKLGTLIILFFGLSISLLAQQDKALVRKGNQDYNDNDYKEAEIKYRKSLEKNKNQVKAKFNLADALYMQENYEEAQKIFEGLSNSDDKKIKSDALYNLGNTFLSQDQYEKSVDAYKNALKANPEDQNARYNLLYAMNKIQEQQQQQDQNQDQDKNQDQNQDQNQNQDQQDQQDKQDQQDQKDQQDQNQDQQNQQQPQNQQISKEDAQKMLQALENNEKKTLEKLKQQKAQQAKAKKVEKDW